jgi:hypothetical protein
VSEAAADPKPEPPVALPGTSVPVTPPKLSVVPVTPKPAPDDSGSIRAVLSRYEAAYSRLDARAAGEVWPGVDRRALARAFDTLASQRVSLGRCNLALHGVTARAQCSGSTTWTPKVGRGPQTQPRTWTFELSKTNDDWVIQNATVK